jgi:hypothetical protein
MPKSVEADSPKGLRRIAQGCRAAATLGSERKGHVNPNGVSEMACRVTQRLRRNMVRRSRFPG